MWLNDIISIVYDYNKYNNYSDIIVIVIHMKQVIHVNQHIIKRNAKTGERVPPLTCKTYKSNSKCSQIIINNHTKVIYSPDKPLPCGAKVWIETTEEVVCIQN